MALLKEIWLNQIMENFYRESDFLMHSMDMSAFVEYNKINLAEVGVDPNVLVNNNTWPITTSQRTDSAIELVLDTLDTENTRVRNVEGMELAYNKRESVIRQHRQALREFCLDKAAHSYAPSSDSADTPVIPTTGAARTLPDLTGNFKRLSLADVASLKRQFDKQSFPKEGRNLVLSPEHVEDLLAEDKDLEKRFAVLRSGEILKVYGFNIYEYSKTALYEESGFTKVAFGAAIDPVNHTISSLAYCESEVMRAQGDIEMFWRPKNENPENRADEIGFQKRFLALPIRSKAIASIYSAST